MAHELRKAGTRHAKAGVKLATMLGIAPVTEATKPGLRGEREANRKTIRAGKAGVNRRTCGGLTRMLFHFACEAAGANGHPAFPAPSSV